MIVYRSQKGSKLTSDEVDGNFQYLENEVNQVANPNRIIILGTESKVDNIYTYQNYVWSLNNIEYTNTIPDVLTIAPATTGFKRKDISVFTNNGTIEIVQGIETDGATVTTPEVPEGTLYFKFYDIDGATVVDDPTIPIVGEQFIKKSDAQPFQFLGSGSDAIIPLSPLGSSEIRLQNPALVSIAGFDLSLITGVSTAEVPYQNKPYQIRNLTGNPVVVKNELIAADSPFFLTGGADLTIPVNESLFVKYDVSGMVEAFKSWSEGGGGSDIIEVANLAALPATGEVAKIYITIDTNLQYRWSGSAYVQVGGGAFEQRIGDEISFDKNSIYNKTTPISTDISFDLTGAILGNKAIVFHNSNSTPSFLGVNLKGVIGYYIPNETNIIELIFLGGTDIIAEIKNQNILLAPFNFDYSVSGSNFILTWDSYIDSNFIIERSTTSDFATKTQVYSGSALTYTDAVSVGVSYFYRIKSVKDNFTDSLWNVIQADNFYVGFLTFTNAKKNLLTAFPNNEYTTSSTTNYEAYGNSDYKIPANTYGFIEINTPDLAKEGSLFGFASTDVNGGFTLTKFAVQTAVGTINIAKFQNGAFVAPEIVGGYSAGANAKLRMVREVSGVCKILKTTDLITWTLVYTFLENYTGELYLIINVRNNVNVISRPFGYNLILK